MESSETKRHRSFETSQDFSDNENKYENTFLERQMIRMGKRCNTSPPHEDKMYHVEIAPGELGEYAIVAGDPGRIPLIASHFDSFREVATNRGFVAYAGTLDGVRVGAVAHGIGGPSMAIVVEELSRCNVRTIIRTGTCGGLQDYVSVSDLVVATAAVRHEGLSGAYVPIEIPLIASLDIVDALSSACKELDAPFHKGLVESKDSFYGEVHPDSMPVGQMLLERWKIMRRVGVLATEMECAALFAVALVRNMRAGAILKTVTSVGEHPGSPDKAHRIEKGVPLDDMIEVTVKALRHLIRMDKALS